MAQEQTGSHSESIAEVGEVQEIPGPVSEDMLEIDPVRITYDTSANYNEQYGKN